MRGYMLIGEEEDEWTTTEIFQKKASFDELRDKEFYELFIKHRQANGKGYMGIHVQRLTEIAEGKCPEEVHWATRTVAKEILEEFKSHMSSGRKSTTTLSGGVVIFRVM